MQLRVIVLVAFLSWPCAAQDVISVYSRLAPAAPSGGNGSQAGIGVDGVVTPAKYLMFDVDTSVVREAKTYIGNGWTWRGQAEGLVGTAPLWFGGGILAARHSNTQYTKWQYQPIVSAHYRPRPEVDAYITYLLRASGNTNGVYGYRVGYRGVFPTSPKVGIFIQGEFTRFRFTDSWGNPYASNVWVSGFGISRINNYGAWKR